MEGSTAVNEQVALPYLRQSDAVEAVRQAATASKYAASMVSADRLSFARTVRPLWTKIGAVLTFPFGLLFLLVKRTETFTIAVEDSHSGRSLRIHGTISPKLLSQIEGIATSGGSRPGAGAALSPTTGDHQPSGLAPFGASTPFFGDASSAAPVIPGASVIPPPWSAPDGPVSIPMPGPAVRPTDLTRMHPGREPGPSSPATRPARPADLALRLPDGTIVLLDERTFVGRDPQPDAADAGLVHLGDTSLSRTHAVFERDGANLWVTDLGSTNGTLVIDATSGHRRDVVVHQRVPVEPGATVVLGAVPLVVVSQSVPA
ncbi:MAG: FHA domain-containing protein [Microthrixaceae bacterium]